jgi:hypothetical protein
MTINTKIRMSVRLNSAAMFITWVSFLTPGVSLRGTVAVPLRLHELRTPAMQPTGDTEFPEHDELVQSTTLKHKIAPERRSHSQSHPDDVPDFFQLGSEVEDNSSHAVDALLSLLQENDAVVYRRRFANATDSVYTRLANVSSYLYKQHRSQSTPIWPWIRLGTIIRKSNHTKKHAENGTWEEGFSAKKNSGTVRKQADADTNVHLDKEERVALLKSVKQIERPIGLPAFFTSIRKYIAGSHRLMTTLDVATLTAAVLLCLYICFVARFGVANGVRAQVESLRVSTGKNIQDIFEIKERYDCCHFEPLSPGVVFRLQGTVNAGSQGKLVAPLSRRDCVHFSASVSSKRHDGINALPIAFHSVCMDFTLTLLDAPHVQVTVYGQDVALFDMTKGTTQDQRRFSESPDHWQDFILTHRAPGHAGASSASLRSENASLEFREVALFTGAIVTCVGELRRGHDGALHLFPCEEIDSGQRGDASQFRTFGERWRTSWERPEAKNAKATDKVFISDDARLLKAPRPGWACLRRHCSGDLQMASINDACADDA